jgi:hypothetical protein
VILIEFALAIPVLIAIVYYLYDIPKYKRMQAKMNFCAHCAVNMIQNNRTKLTKSDLAEIFSAAFLTVFPGKTQFSGDAGLPIIYVFYVRGENNGSASVIWMWDSSVQGSSPFPRNTVKVSAGEHGDSRRPVRYKTNAEPKEIYENLSIQPGEVKMIVSISRVCSPVTIAKKTFGFYVMNPSPYRKNGLYTYSTLFFFSTIVVFTPNPGLFDEDHPN